jgi:hypothetical protein
MSGLAYTTVEKVIHKAAGSHTATPRRYLVRYFSSDNLGGGSSAPYKGSACVF